MAETAKEGIPLSEQPTGKIHDYVTWETSTPIFDDGRGGLEFPEQNNSGCPDGTPLTISVSENVTYNDSPVDISEVSFVAVHNVDLYDGETLNTDKINVVVTDFHYENGNGTLTISDDLTKLVSSLASTGSIKPNSYDLLANTTLVSSVTLDWDNADISAEGTTVSFTGNIEYPFGLGMEDISFDLVVELDYSDTDEVYVYLCHQTNSLENGLYSYMSGAIRRIGDAPVYGEPLVLGGEGNPLDDTTVNDNVPCCGHYRKGYSHREVYDRVHSDIGAVTSFGVKSLSVSDCDGGFIDWFTTNGDIDIGNGHESVFVRGFGLGGMYQGNVYNAEKKVPLPSDDYDENDGTLHPLLEWAYGTRYDSRTDSNEPALPLDWPFTQLNSTADSPVFNKPTDTNNITLVKSCDRGVGNLERDVEDEETGEITHVFNNRHHIVLYPEFSAISGQESYKEGSVVVKPLFVHIPASLDTKDGETVDITFSIQNVDQSAFGDTSTEEGKKAALSGYYAAMSQPRVYVMGGVQQFSTKKITIDRDSITPYTEEYIPDDADEEVEPIILHKYRVSSATPAYDSEGTLLSSGSEIRANIVVSHTNATGNRRTFTAHGTIESNTVSNGFRASFDGDFPFDVGGPGWNKLVFTICGIAFLEVGDNPTGTPMGLVSRNKEMLEGDMGTGDAGELDEYNKFYSVRDSEGRTKLPHVDKRYLLATVYQTATSTFPWSITKKRKMAHIADSWTDEFHRGKNSLLHLVYEENRKMYNHCRDYISDNGYSSAIVMSAKDEPLSYRTRGDAWSGNDWKTLASVLRVGFPDKYNLLPCRDPYGNPVRQAIRAVNNLVSDFTKMRLVSYTGNKKARVKVSRWSINPRTSWSGNLYPNWNVPPYDYEANSWQAELIESTWCSRMRHLPDYVVNVNTGKSTEGNYLSTLKCLFFDSSLSEDWAIGWINYINGNNGDDCIDYPYNKTVSGSSPELQSSDCTDESIDPATVLGVPGTYGIYSSNTVVEGLITKLHRNKLARFDTFMADMRRYSETVLAVKVDEDTAMNLSAVHFDPYNEWMNPFTNIQSIDAMPLPDIDSYPELSGGQIEFVSSDAVQSYSYELDGFDDPLTSLSTIMETDSDLAKVLESYVAAYSAEMPKHLYQGTRILCKSGNIPSEGPIYLRVIDRVRQRLFNGETGDLDFVSNYIDDNFAETSADTRDPNVDRANVDGPSISVSAPPYVQQNDYTNQTYTRVFMQFTFSQKAGRWYTTDYRQYPTNYLSPLYGADALGTTWDALYTEDGDSNMTMVAYNQPMDTSAARENQKLLWRNSACLGFNSYRTHMYAPYSMVPPMDITLGCVPFLNYDTSATTDKQSVYDVNDTDPSKWSDYDKGPARVREAYKNGDDVDVLRPLYRLEEPFRPYGDGGINLYPPADVNGGHKNETDGGVHANFWSVRKYIRPAVSVLPGTDVPGVDVVPEDESVPPAPAHRDGRFSDPTLYRMFDFPKAGVVEYKLPGNTDPSDNIHENALLYHVETGVPVEHVLAGGPSKPGDYILIYGTKNKPPVHEDENP